jgi:hypothetical protein
MDMSEESHKQCGELATQRMRYFTGRYMTARDFSDEQLYHLTHRYLHNRMMHGWGVVCGLHVYEHPTEGCRTDRVTVNSGMAVDCCGREIVLDHRIVPPPIPWKDKPGDDHPQEAAREPESEYATAQEDRRWYPLLCIRYFESQLERVPVLYSESGCDEQRREYSRVSEGYGFEWHWVRHRDLPTYYWKIINGRCDDDAPDQQSRPEHEPEQQGAAAQETAAPAGGAYEKPAEHESESEERKKARPCPEDDCYQSTHDQHFVSCLEPRCPPHHCVPLAWIRVKPGRPIRSDDIVMLGRPTLRPPVQSLTHICSINWPHGGIMSRRQLERLRRLEVRFDRRLKRLHSEPNVCGPYGINPCTFDVKFGGGYEDLDFVTYEKPPHVEHECIAVFHIEPRSRNKYGHELPYSYLENQIVYISLKCDFILDCHGVPVDGNHLAGLLPSGDGRPGGTFESWFRVVPDHEWDGRRREQRQDREPYQDEEQRL